MQQPALTFASCERTPTDDPGGVVSTCTIEQTRAALRCGEPGTNLDANCCRRKECNSGADCDAGEVCISRLAQPKGETHGTYVDRCLISCGKCECGDTADIDLKSYCIAASEDIARFDCDTSEATCAELEAWSRGLIAPEVFRAPRVPACLLKLDAERRARCTAQVGPCTCDAVEPVQCTTDLPTIQTFSGSEAPRSRASLEANICTILDSDHHRFSECEDGSVRFEFSVGGENAYHYVFRDQELTYASAHGYVGAICERDPSDWITLSAGTPPSSVNCRSCNPCASGSRGGDGAAGAGGADGSGALSRCIRDSSGALAVPL